MEDYTEKIRKKIEKELRYYRVQNIRLMQEIDELESVVMHNRGRLSRIEDDRILSERIVNKLREVTGQDGN